MITETTEMEEAKDVKRLLLRIYKRYQSGALTFAIILDYMAKPAILPDFHFELTDSTLYNKL